MCKRARWAVALAIVVGTLVVAFPAQAYDEGTCGANYGAQNVESVRRFRIDTSPYSSPSGRADFGDAPYSYGSPQGTAVVCWLTHGRAAVVGRLFVDSTEALDVQARVTLYLADGSAAYDRTFELVGKSGDSLQVTAARLAGGTHTKVRIELSVSRRRVATQSYYR